MMAKYYPQNYKEKDIPYPYESWDREGRPINQENLFVDDDGDVVTDTEYNPKTELADVLSGRSAGDDFAEYEAELFDAIDNGMPVPEWGRVSEPWKEQEENKPENKSVRKVASRRAPKDAIPVPKDMPNAVWSSDIHEEDEEAYVNPALSEEDFPTEERNARYQNKVDKKGQPGRKWRRGGRSIFFQEKKERQKERPSNRDFRHAGWKSVYENRKNQGSRNERQYIKRDLKQKAA